MRIVIAQKFRPFSHTPGTCCLIPNTTWQARIYPAKIFFHNLARKGAKEIDLDIKGPVKGFTILLNLEMGRIEVFGRGKEGYFRYFITPEKYSFLQSYDLKTPKMKLSMGIHKNQDWDLIQRRMDMAEIFPFWLLMAEWIPMHPLPELGTGILLKNGELELTYRTAFQGILCPRLKDENYLGIIPDLDIPKDMSPLGIIHEGARQIKQLFFQEEGDIWHFLPHLPKEFHSGRLIHLESKQGDEIHIEWSKKALKKVIIKPSTCRTISLKLQKGLKSFRMRTHLRQKGSRKTIEIPLEARKTLYLDRFMR